MDINFDFQSGDFFDEGKTDILNISDHAIQNLACRLDTELGEHFYWTDYGSEMYLNIGQTNSPNTHASIIQMMIDAVNSDDRIPENSVWIQLVSQENTVELTVKISDKELKRNVW